MTDQLQRHDQREKNLIDALNRIAELTPGRANASTAQEMHHAVRAIALQAILDPDPGSVVPELTKPERDTLRELANYRHGQYYFRQATCRKLVSKGLARPLSEDLKMPAHEITAAGRDMLQKLNL